MPASVAVPLPLSANVTPEGKAPVSVMAAVGKPVVVTVNEPAWPTVKVVWPALVIAGAWLTVRVKFWVALGKMPLAAVKVRDRCRRCSLGCSRQRRGAVGVVGQGHARGQGTRLGDGGRRVAGGGDREAPQRAGRERRVIEARDGGGGLPVR